MPGIVDEEGNPWHNEDARHRQMMEGVEGSHLCIPFQCEMCWYWNLEGRNPTPGKDDVNRLAYGQSITDACLGWGDSLQALEVLSGAVQKARSARG